MGEEYKELGWVSMKVFVPEITINEINSILLP